MHERNPLFDSPASPTGGYRCFSPLISLPPPFAQISLPRCRRPPFSTSPIAARNSGPSQAASTRQHGRARADGTGSRGQQAAAPDPRGTWCYCCSCPLWLRVHGVAAPRSGSEVCGEERKEGASSVGARMRGRFGLEMLLCPQPEPHLLRSFSTTLSSLRRFLLVQLWWVAVDGQRRGGSCLLLIPLSD